MSVSEKKLKGYMPVYTIVIKIKMSTLSTFGADGEAGPGSQLCRKRQCVFVGKFMEIGVYVHVQSMRFIHTLHPNIFAQSLR